MRNIRNWIAVIVLFAVVFALYSTALKLNFLYHDDYIIIKAGLMPPAKYFLGDWTGIKGMNSLYRPLIVVSGIIDRTIWGLNPFGYHLSNLIYHSINAAMVFLIGSLAVGNFSFAFVSALLFAILPINSEAVNWIACRCDLIATLFYLVSFYFYLRYSKEKHAWLLAASIAGFVLSLLSKESAITLPVMILCYEWVNGDLKKGLRSLVIFASLYVPYFAIRFLSLGTFIGGYKLPLAESIVKAFLGPLRIFQLVFLPFVQDDLLLYFVLMPLIVVCMTAILVLYILKGKPGRFFYFSALWVVVGLLPVLNILSIGFDFRGARLWYLPSAGIAWILAYPVFVGAGKLNRALDRPIKLAFFLFVIYSAIFLIVINRDWTIASDMTRHVRAEAIRRVEALPRGSTVYFWNIPDNYKGCYVGMPYLEEPFYKTDRKIWGYQTWTTDVSEVPGPLASKDFHYMYDMSTGKFEQVSYGYVRSHALPVLTDPWINKKKFIRFLQVLNRHG